VRGQTGNCLFYLNYAMAISGPGFEALIIRLS
jgi:hypothetical protein